MRDYRARSAIAATLLLTLAAANPAQADATPFTPPETKTEVTPGKVKLGEPFAYTVTLHHPKSQRIDFETPKSLGAFELLDTQRQRSDAADAATTVFTLKMSLFELGPQKLPDLQFTATTPESSNPFTVKGATVEGASTLPDNAEQQGADFEDIKPLEPVPVRTWRLVYILLGLAAAGAAAYFFYRWLKNRPPRVQLVPPPLPLDVRVRQSLDALKAEDLPAQGRQREFYFRLSEIIRGYLDERYRIEALEATSTELLRNLETVQDGALPRGELVHFIHESDLVKFARAEVGEQTCNVALDLGYALLQRTWPPPPPPELTANENVPGPHVP